MFRNTRKAVHVGVLGTAALLANVPAAACDMAPVYEKEDTYATKVKFDDLNLNRQAGAETLYQRLQSAARRVCGSPHKGSAYLDPFRDRDRCYADALQRAVDGVDNTHLTALHMQRTGHRQRAGNELAVLRR